VLDSHEVGFFLNALDEANRALDSPVYSHFLGEEVILRHALAACGVAADSSLLRAVLVEYGRAAREAYRHHPALRVLPAPALRRLLGSVRKRGVGLGVISNERVTSPAVYLDVLGLPKAWFSVVVTSDECGGVGKPNPLIFREALRRADVAPRDAVYLGDDLEKDIRASKAVGMKAVWCTWFKRDEPQGAAAAAADAVLSDLRELPRLLDRWS